MGEGDGNNVASIQINLFSSVSGRSIGVKCDDDGMWLIKLRSYVSPN